jgi:hypothetical protein
MTIEGTVVYKDLEGGFWALLSNDGRQFVPVSPLPENLREQGKRIVARLAPVQILSSLQWGEHVEVEHIEATL